MAFLVPRAYPGMLWVVDVLSPGAVIQVEYQIHFLL